MRKKAVRRAILARLVLLSVAVFLLPTLLNANVFSHLKHGKHKRQQSSKLTAAQTAGIQRMRRMESFPGRTKEGDREGGPLAYEMEKLANKAYPGTDIPFELSKTASQHFTRVKAQSEANRPQGPQWVSIGPSVALYPPVLGRTGAAYVASGRISALAIEHNCHHERCRLYVGAAGGGIWRTNNAMSDHPRWTQISDSFATNAIGAITIDP